MSSPTIQSVAATEQVNSLPLNAMLKEYRIDQVLGSGAFGITYRGTDTHLSMPVAIKTALTGNTRSSNKAAF